MPSPMVAPNRKVFILTAGPQADVSHAPSLLEHASGVHALMDRAYDSDGLRELIASKGMKACLRPRKNRNGPTTYDQELRKQRHLVENFIEKLKSCRRVATRYCKTASSFMAFVLIACCILNLRKQLQNTA